MVVLAHIREQFAVSLGSCGRPRMAEELKELGLEIEHRRVGRLMRENEIEVKRNKTFKVTTDSNHAFNIAPNLLSRNFHADAPNQKWAGDITYVWTREGWLYLAFILDLHSRRVIGWAVSNRMKRDLAIRALNMALLHCPRTNGGQGLAVATATKGLHSPYRLRQPILLSRLPEGPAPTWVPGINEWDWQLLRVQRWSAKQIR